MRALIARSKICERGGVIDDYQFRQPLFRQAKFPNRCTPRETHEARRQAEEEDDQTAIVLEEVDGRLFEGA